MALDRVNARRQEGGATSQQLGPTKGGQRLSLDQIARKAKLSPPLAKAALKQFGTPLKSVNGVTVADQADADEFIADVRRRRRVIDIQS